MKHLITFLYWLSETSDRWATVLWLRECRKSEKEVEIIDDLGRCYNPYEK